MAVHPMYAKGYDAGYKQGMLSGLKGSKARLVMERDMVFIYGTLCLALVERHHWKPESVEKLIAEVQEEWMALERDNPDGTKETMTELVERRTGIRLEQMVQDVVTLGMGDD